MTDDYLEKITISIPGTDTGLAYRLVSLLEKLGERKSHGLEFAGSDRSYYPRLAIDFPSARSAVRADFLLSSGDVVPLAVENTTGGERKSPHSYQRVEMETIARRFAVAGMKIIEIDHLGLNLPWFEPGIHPHILRLRETMKTRCLFHRYPTGEPWDFILPGTPDEIASPQAVDYGRVRRPKFELVSFDQASKPLIQIDLGVNAKYETYAGLFPEALSDPAFRNLWIYLENPHPVDICLVVNENSEGDWSGFFNGCRL